MNTETTYIKENFYAVKVGDLYVAKCRADGKGIKLIELTNRIADARKYELYHPSDDKDYVKLNEESKKKALELHCAVTKQFGDIAKIVEKKVSVNEIERGFEVRADYKGQLRLV